MVVVVIEVVVVVVVMMSDDKRRSWSIIYFLRVFCYKKSVVMDRQTNGPTTDKHFCRDLQEGCVDV